MAAVLSAFGLATGVGEVVTAEQIASTYAHVSPMELERSVVIIEHADDGIVGYGRTAEDDTPEGRIQYWVAPLHPGHLTQPLYALLVAGLEQRGADRAAEQPGLHHIFRTWMGHPGPGQPLGDTPVAWLHDMGYRVVRFGASMVRPHLDDILELPLPDGAIVRPVEPADIRAIWEADVAAFAGGFGAETPTEERWLQFRDDPNNDLTLWKVAWCDGRVVGQVRSFINVAENASEQRLRGYTEHISTNVDWRGRGLASALLAESLREVRNRGMTEAGLGVDTENPADALAIYERLGFQVVGYEAVLDKPVPVVANALPISPRATE